MAFIRPNPELLDSKYATDMHQWMRQQIDLVGAWVDKIDASYRPRAIAINKMSQGDWHDAAYLVENIGSIYKKVGSLLKRDLHSHSQRVPEICCLSQPELDVLLATDVHSQIGTTLRVDCIERNGLLQIIEVNTDCVAGHEDLLLYMSFFEASIANNSELLEQISSAKTTVESTYLKWLESQCDCSLAELKSRTIAVGYDDRDDSVFLARFVAEWLRSHGFNAVPCRPEHLSILNNTLYVSGVAGSAPTPVTILLRHWLFMEMFDYRKPMHPVLFPRFRAIVNALEGGLVVMLNPFVDRLLFSKAILASLCNHEVNEFGLDKSELEFVKAHIPETVFYDKYLRSQWVTKPSVLFGGLGVVVNEAVQPVLSGYHLPQSSWVRQRTVEGEKINWPYSHDAGLDFNPTDLHVVQGLLMYDTGGRYELAGAMTRAGPDSVVNYSKGAQIIPSI